MSKQPKAVDKRDASITALPLYYSGHLLKKTIAKKNFKPYFGELRGSLLFLYEHEAQEMYTEKLDLEQVKSMDLNKPCVSSTILTFTLQKEDVLLKVENTATAEEWRCYLLTMAKKVTPSNTILLPGQKFKLKEALDQELVRRNGPGLCPPPPPPRPFLRSASASSASSASASLSSASASSAAAPLSSASASSASAPLSSASASSASASLSSASASCSPQRTTAMPNPSNSDMPVCFFNVTRQEAKAMLEQNPQNGNIILRPSSGGSHAVTLRLLLDSGPVLRHYKVTSSPLGGLIIHFDKPVTVHSFTDVINHFLEKMAHHLCIYSESQVYDTSIDPLPVLMRNSISSPSPSNIPRAQEEPALVHEAGGEYLEADKFCSMDPNPKPDSEESELDRNKEDVDAKTSRDQGSNEKRLSKGSIFKVGWAWN